MEADEPIEVISTQEASQLQRQYAQAELDNSEETAKIGRRIWKLALEGKNKDEIGQKLKLSTAELDSALAVYRIRLGASVDHYRLLDNERLEAIIARWMPVAVGEPIVFRKIRDGEPVNEIDVLAPMRAAQTVMQAIDKRLKVLGATKILEADEGAPGTRTTYSERNIVVWLKEVMPSIERITREIEIDNGFIHPNGDGNGNGNGTS